MAKYATITRQARERIMNEVVYEMMYGPQEAADSAYSLNKKGGWPLLMRAAMKSAMGKMTMHLIVDQWDEQE